MSKKHFYVATYHSHINLSHSFYRNSFLLTAIDIQFSSAVFGNFTITFDPAFSSLSFSGRKRHTTRMLSSAAISRSADMFIFYFTHNTHTRNTLIWSYVKLGDVCESPLFYMFYCYFLLILCSVIDHRICFVDCMR